MEHGVWLLLNTLDWMTTSMQWQLSKRLELFIYIMYTSEKLLQLKWGGEVVLNHLHSISKRAQEHPRRRLQQYMHSANAPCSIHWTARGSFHSLT